jgi:hypothetical protein
MAGYRFFGCATGDCRVALHLHVAREALSVGSKNILITAEGTNNMKLSYSAEAYGK